MLVTLKPLYYKVELLACIEEDIRLSSVLSTRVLKSHVSKEGMIGNIEVK